MRFLKMGIMGLVLAGASSVQATESSRFVVFSDVHLDPFRDLKATAAAGSPLLDTDPRQWASLYQPGATPAPYGQDANVALFQSALADLKKRVPDPDFIVYPGDFLVHSFGRRAEQAVGPHGGDTRRALAVGTITFMRHAFRARYPDTPILPALGNTDNACGDYATAPNSPFLHDLVPLVKDLVGEKNLLPGFESSFTTGGYYAARHPTVPGGRIVVLNNVLWSAKYQNRCGDAQRDGDPGQVMMAWLHWQLANARLTGAPVWLIYHIPTGMDAYATHKADRTACGGAVVSMWHPRYQEGFLDLVNTYADVLKMAFSGHTHHDGFRLVRAAAGEPVMVEKGVAGVSPIYYNAPAYAVVPYDRTTGRALDWQLVGLSNLKAAHAGTAAPAWTPVYDLRSTFGVSGLDLPGMRRLWRGLGHDPALTDTFRKTYNAGHGQMKAADVPVYHCTFGFPGRPRFEACRCLP